MKILGIIPARYQSSRFPGKPLADISGKPMIQRVYEGAIKFKGFDKVIVATDDDRIKDTVLKFGGYVCMTDSNIPSGTDRCATVINTIEEEYDAVINIQGDEPLVSIQQLELLKEALHLGAELCTLKKEIIDTSLINNPNCVKVVTNVNDNALYFSRSAIPMNRNNTKNVRYFKHIGLYGYTTNALEKITKLNPSKLEEIESLEQLRWLENDFKINVKETKTETASIDTPEDLENFLIKFKDKLD